MKLLVPVANDGEEQNDSSEIVIFVPKANQTQTKEMSCSKKGPFLRRVFVHRV